MLLLCKPPTSQLSLPGSRPLSLTSFRCVVRCYSRAAPRPVISRRALSRLVVCMRVSVCNHSKRVQGCPLLAHSPCLLACRRLHTYAHGTIDRRTDRHIVDLLECQGKLEITFSLKIVFHFPSIHFSILTLSSNSLKNVHFFFLFDVQSEMSSPYVFFCSHAK